MYALKKRCSVPGNFLQHVSFKKGTIAPEELWTWMKISPNKSPVCSFALGSKRIDYLVLGLFGT